MTARLSRRHLDLRSKIFGDFRFLFSSKRFQEREETAGLLYILAHYERRAEKSDRRQQRESTEEPYRTGTSRLGILKEEDMRTHHETLNLNPQPEYRMKCISFLAPSAFAPRKVLAQEKSYAADNLGIKKDESVCKLNAIYVSMSAGSDKRTSLPDFDRDYFDELKAEYGHLPGVRIFSRKDYTLNPHDAPWLFDDRARDLDKIREDLKHVSLAEGELEGLPSRPMRVSDLHTKEEIDHFDSQFRVCDSVKGDVWEDPIPESDLEGDPNWIDLRKMEDSEVKAVQEAPELWFDGMDTPALKRKQYGSEQEEKDALMSSFEKLQAERYNVSFQTAGYGERNVVPTSEEFSAWQREAEVRGGNATKFESYGLSPFNVNSISIPSTRLQKSDGIRQAPGQHQTLVTAHKGKWKGKGLVISVCDEGAFSPRLLSSFNAHSEVTRLSDGSLEWTTTTSTAGDGEIVSSITFSSLDCKEALTPGRAVSEDGSYVCKSDRKRYSTTVPRPISLSLAAAKSISQDQSCEPVVEIGLMTKSKGIRCRHRVVLCVCRGTAENSNKKHLPKFTTAIVFTEVPQAAAGPGETCEQTKPTLPSATLSELLGTWDGTGLLLQPEYPPMSCQLIETKHSLMIKKSINENDISFVENTIPEHPGKESKRRVRTLGKKKISKRVAASKAHDRRRLAPCNLLSVQKIGGNMEKRFAWHTIPKEEEFSFMYSPRVGRFVDDYCGLVVSDSLLCTFPFSRATPNMWNEITLTELTTPKRKRITVGRNESGDIVGVLFVKEVAEDGTASDSVASYV